MPGVASRRRGLVALALVWLAGCAAPPSSTRRAAAARAAIAPTGALRIAVYGGSPTSMVRLPGVPEMRGLSIDLGRELARRLEIEAEIVVLARAAEVVDALKAGRADFTITNATPARAAELDFTSPLVALELGYLVLTDSPVRAIADVDQPGRRIGVSQGSTSQGALTQQFRHAAVVPAPSLDQAARMLVQREIDAFATNKAILHELADRLPGTAVLPGRWGLEQLAIALPKGRDPAGLAFLSAYAEEARRGGAVQRAAQRAGLRGSVAPTER